MGHRGDKQAGKVGLGALVPSFSSERDFLLHLPKEFLRMRADLRPGSGLDDGLDLLPIAPVHLQTPDERALLLLGPSPYHLRTRW